MRFTIRATKRTKKNNIPATYDRARYIQALFMVVAVLFAVVEPLLSTTISGNR
jgi:hypothetical protein